MIAYAVAAQVLPNPKRVALCREHAVAIQFARQYLEGD